MLIQVELIVDDDLNPEHRKLDIRNSTTDSLRWLADQIDAGRIWPLNFRMAEAEKIRGRRQYFPAE